MKLYTSALALIGALIATQAQTQAHADWQVDLSRRVQKTRTDDLREPASTDQPIQATIPQQQQQQPQPDTSNAAPQPGFFQSLFQNNATADEIVVLNTEKGFVPSTIRVKKGLAYQIHVVNVNDKDKNVSFVLDSFSEHHATFYGKIKSFTIHPQKEGVFRFVSPETSAQGKLVVLPAPTEKETRIPASEN